LVSLLNLTVSAKVLASSALCLAVGGLRISQACSGVIVLLDTAIFK